MLYAKDIVLAPRGGRLSPCKTISAQRHQLPWRVMSLSSSLKPVVTKQQCANSIPH